MFNRSTLTALQQQHSNFSRIEYLYILLHTALKLTVVHSVLTATLCTFLQDNMPLFWDINAELGCHSYAPCEENSVFWNGCLLIVEVQQAKSSAWNLLILNTSWWHMMMSTWRKSYLSSPPWRVYKPIRRCQDRTQAGRIIEPPLVAQWVGDISLCVFSYRFAPDRSLWLL